MAARFQKLQLGIFAHLSSEMTHFDALSVLKSKKLVNQNGRRTAQIKGINKNHSIHHFLPTILLQGLAKVE